MARNIEADHDPLVMRERLNVLERELAALRRQIETPEQARESLPKQRFQMLVTRIADDLYGFPIDVIVEIVRYAHLAQIADVPDGVVGAVNLRGTIHAVLDARLRFGQTATRPRLGTSIVLVAVARHRVGVLVDRVLDVVPVEPTRLEVATGPLSGALGVRALTTMDGSVVQLIDVAHLLRPASLDALHEALESIKPDAGESSELAE